MFCIDYYLLDNLLFEIGFCECFGIKYYFLDDYAYVFHSIWINAETFLQFLV